MYSIQPLIWFRLLWKSRKIPDYRRRWGERYGFCHGKVQSGGILIHSVSVGETLSSIPLVHALRRRYPYFPITITTTTPTGSKQAQLIFGDDVRHVYLPYDLPRAVNRFLDQIKPKLFIIMETEIWPNLIRQLYCRHIPIIIANARLSISSTLKYKKIIRFITPIIRCITLIAAQNEEYGDRFLELGLEKNQLAIIGNIKFDIMIDEKLVKNAQFLRSQWALHRQVWIATSTHRGEEKLILQAHRKLLVKFPNLLLILVPRHPERFLSAKKITLLYGLNCLMRSTGEIPSDNIQVVIGDTMGELMLLYGISDLAFIGGSLINYGGHNPLEAAAHGIPVLMGPYTINFRDICHKLNESDGLITVTDVLLLVTKISHLLTDEDYRIRSGQNALKVLHQNQGASKRLLNLLEIYLE